MLSYQQPLMQTSLTVDEFGRFFGLHPWFLYQFSAITQQTIMVTQAQRCDQVTYQLQWQHEALSRFEISRAIHDAEWLLADWLGYYPGEMYFENEEHPFPYNVDKPCWKSYWNKCGELPLLQTKYGYVKRTGLLTLTELLVDEAVTLQKSFASNIVNGVDVNDQFTLSFAVPAGTNAEDIQVYYGETWRENTPLDFWQIRPLRITVDSATNTATVIGPVYLIIKPEHLLKIRPEALRITDSTVYIDSVDIYIRSFDTDYSATFYWDDCCSVETGLSCVTEYNKKYGFLKAKPVSGLLSQSETCPELTYIRRSCSADSVPTSITFNYLSGCTSEQCKQAVLYLAAGLLQCLPCGCACDNDEYKLQKYAKPPTINTGRGVAFTKLRKMEDTPFGDSLGAILAYDIVKNIKMTKPMVV